MYQTRPRKYTSFHVESKIHVSKKENHAEIPFTAKHQSTWRLPDGAGPAAAPQRWTVR